ncbi:alpha/beta hydrolase [Luteipulveratus halotolerans]|uniref:Alpha/beta hydrolase fold-3 domain-containing protein n=1 Tax=Luteipulveratus halotolerans TaxID=1631356 RepID=A0A0L6CNC9_9MICO|nr:alpha/beta hydrolase [Luteipulveratus halotolerans]KNX39296.1 hypothetical protein VV01_07800 [Luteipulveratus halotolerans]
MPWRTRLFTAAYDRLLAEHVDRMSPDQIARGRARSLPSVPPVTWITGRVPRAVQVTTTTCPTRDGDDVPVRVLRPAGVGADAPAVVFLHGGGWTVSNPRNYDSLTTWMADSIGAVVIAPDYRKAPQHRAPTAAYDCFDVLAWAAEHPQAVGGHNGRIALAGDSAGGNLSAVVSLLARDAGGPPVAGQALIYPATDLTRSHASSHWAHEAVLSGPRLEAFLAFYLDGSGIEPDNPLVSPQFASSHADLPPTLIQVAGCDPLRDEAEHYGELLRAAGNDVQVSRYAGMPHGFMSFPGAAPAARRARSELRQSLAAWLAVAPT